MVGHAAMLALQAFSNLNTPPDVFGPVGHLVALVGLVGLYSTLADRMPTIGRAAGVVAIVALGSWAVMTVFRFLAVAGVIPSVSEFLPGAFFGFLFASTIVTYVLFGGLTIRTRQGSRVVGLLLLAPASLLVVVLVDSAITGVTALDGLVVGGGLALSMLALGYAVEPLADRTDSDVRAGDVTVG